jgi:hypothetical protein
LSAMPSHTALDMEQQLTPQMVCQLASAAAWTISLELIVPFHLLARVQFIAMGMPLWMRTTQMDASATARMDGLVMTARLSRQLQPLLPPPLPQPPLPQPHVVHLTKTATPRRFNVVALTSSQCAVGSHGHQ